MGGKLGASLRFGKAEHAPKQGFIDAVSLRIQ
jgi:hypothetical protein